VPFSLIAAIASRGIIGDRGALPWRLPDDMARFKRLTMGHAVVMGRTTWESLGRPLAGRRNIVLTRTPGLEIPGCTVVRSVQEAGAAAGDGEVFIIGGAAVYAQFLPLAARMYLTMIDAEVAGDTVFPAVDWDQWRVVKEEAAPPSARGLPHRFVDYERRAP
jgi:dihydrofolate reductase